MAAIGHPAAASCTSLHRPANDDELAQHRPSMVSSALPSSSFRPSVAGQNAGLFEITPHQPYSNYSSSLPTNEQAVDNWTAQMSITGGQLPPSMPVSLLATFPVHTPPHPKLPSEARGFAIHTYGSRPIWVVPADAYMEKPDKLRLPAPTLKGVSPWDALNNSMKRCMEERNEAIKQKDELIAARQQDKLKFEAEAKRAADNHKAAIQTLQQQHTALLQQQHVALQHQHDTTVAELQHRISRLNHLQIAEDARKAALEEERRQRSQEMIDRSRKTRIHAAPWQMATGDAGYPWMLLDLTNHQDGSLKRTHDEAMSNPIDGAAPSQGGKKRCLDPAINSASSRTRKIKKSDPKAAARKRNAKKGNLVDTNVGTSSSETPAVEANEDGDDNGLEEAMVQENENSQEAEGGQSTAGDTSFADLFEEDEDDDGLAEAVMEVNESSQEAEGSQFAAHDISSDARDEEDMENDGLDDAWQEALAEDGEDEEEDREGSEELEVFNENGVKLGYVAERVPGTEYDRVVCVREDAEQELGNEMVFRAVESDSESEEE